MNATSGSRAPTRLSRMRTTGATSASSSRVAENGRALPFATAEVVGRAHLRHAARAGLDVGSAHGRLQLIHDGVRSFGPLRHQRLAFLDATRGKTHHLVGTIGG